MTRSTKKPCTAKQSSHHTLSPTWPCVPRGTYSIPLALVAEHSNCIVRAVVSVGSISSSAGLKKEASFEQRTETNHNQISKAQSNLIAPSKSAKHHLKSISPSSRHTISEQSSNTPNERLLTQFHLFYVKQSSSKRRAAKGDTT